ncbi:MAG: hypothetical protein KDK70_27425 [Myxococcales bacterium]|nr:hypothetical protein [Myxococcales bacterium]
MMQRVSLRSWSRPWCLLLGATLAVGLGCPHEPEEGNEADHVGVAAQCQVDADCEYDPDTDGEPFELRCLTNFKGGYCGVVDCASHDDCPDGSACVFDDSGQNYCFRLCESDADCNQQRPSEVAATCSSSVRFAGSQDLSDARACIPPVEAR